MQIFDVYHGAGVADGSKSVSMSLVLQHQSKTLTDDETEGQVQRVLNALQEKFGAELRT